SVRVGPPLGWNRNSLMTIAEDVESRPAFAMPPRPARPLSPLRILKIARTNSLAICDEELFVELFVERRFLWRRFFIISDPDGIRRVLQDNWENFPRLDQVRRIFEFGTGSGMLCAEGDEWQRHRRLINPTLDHRSIVSAVPMLTRFAEELARRLAALSPGEEFEINEAITHWLTRS